MPQIKFLGVTDDITTCECCGRTGLKRTVVIELDGAVTYYGTSCAANKLGRTNAQITRSAEKAQAETDRLAARRAHVEELIADRDRLVAAFNTHPNGARMSLRDFIDQLRAQAEKF